MMKTTHKSVGKFPLVLALLLKAPFKPPCNLLNRPMRQQPPVHAWASLRQHQSAYSSVIQVLIVQNISIKINLEHATGWGFTGSPWAGRDRHMAAQAEHEEKHKRQSHSSLMASFLGFLAFLVLFFFPCFLTQKSQAHLTRSNPAEIRVQPGCTVPFLCYRASPSCPSMVITCSTVSSYSEVSAVFNQSFLFPQLLSTTPFGKPFTGSAICKPLPDLLLSTFLSNTKQFLAETRSFPTMPLSQVTHRVHGGQPAITPWSPRARLSKPRKPFSSAVAHRQKDTAPASNQQCPA